MTLVDHRRLSPCIASLAVALAMALATCTTVAAKACSPDVLADQATIRTALADVASYGLRGRHYYEITFLSSAEGVTVPANERKKFPDLMTIVLQYQFAKLKVTDKRFDVVLWFKGVKSQVTVPFDTITSFIDPSVNVRIEFDTARDNRRCETSP